MIKYTAKLEEILNLYLPKTHLSRKKMMCALVLAILERKSVNFVELSAEINDEVLDESNLRRIQSFFADFDWCYFGFGKLMLSFVGHLRLDLSIDRTNWSFGETDFNVLALTVRYKGVGLPIFFEMLEKQGNSNQGERQDLLQKFIDAFGAKRIGSLCADREFVGDKWFKYLIDRQIPFFVRLRKSHRIGLGGILYRLETLCEICHRKKKQHLVGVQSGECGNLLLGLKKLSVRKGTSFEVDILAVITNQQGAKPLQEYRKRWSIEVFFQSIKKRGFDLEQTHLKGPQKLKKLFAIVAMAFALCLSVGLRHDKSVKSIERKNHGYKQNSFFRVGLNKIRKAIKAVKLDFSCLNDILSIILAQIFKFAHALKIIT